MALLGREAQPFWSFMPQSDRNTVSECWDKTKTLSWISDRRECVSAWRWQIIQNMPVGQEYGIKTANTCQQSSENVPISKWGEIKRIKVKIVSLFTQPHVILNLMNPYASLFHTEKSQKPNNFHCIIYMDSSPKNENSIIYLPSELFQTWIFWRMLVTKGLMVAIDFHSVFFMLFKSMATNVLQNILFCVQKKK